MSKETLNTQSGGGDCGCDSNSGTVQDDSIFNLIKLNGGNKENITQFYAIKELSCDVNYLPLHEQFKILKKIKRSFNDVKEQVIYERATFAFQMLLGRL
jgi:hypothetical protein